MVVLMKPFCCLAALYVSLAAQEPGSRQPDRVVSISAERFTYSPSRINLKQGELVEFVLTSEDTDHGFRIQGTSIDVTIPPQGRGAARVRFLVNKKGQYVFECTRPCGAGHNLMRGIIVVK